MTFESMTIILAQTTQSAQPAQPPMSSMLYLFAPMLLIFYFLIIRPKSAENKRRTQMLGQIAKNDRVVTIGGIIGTVTSVQDDEITVKVDESNNTKITFSRSGIQKVVSSDDGAGVEKKAK